MSMMSPIQTTALNLGTEFLVRAGPGLAQIRPVRQAIVHRVEFAMLDGLKRSRAASQYPPGVDEDRTLMGLALLHTLERALTDHTLSPAGRRCLFKNLMQKLLVEQGDHAAMARFSAQYGVDPPFFMTISPSKACNLRCTGCYADSGPQARSWTGRPSTAWSAKPRRCGVHASSPSAAASRWPIGPMARACWTWPKGTRTASS